MSWEEFDELVAPDSGVDDIVYGKHYNAILHHGLVKSASFIVRNETYCEAIEGRGETNCANIAYGGQFDAGGADGADDDEVIQAAIDELEL